MSMMANPYARPVAQSPANERVAFLRKVAGLVFLGLIVASVACMACIAAILAIPALTGTIPSMIIMFGGIYYGAMYGGSTTSILVKMPGEASSVMTALDGFRMTRKGRGGAALATAAIGSFVAGTFATMMLMLMVV